MILFDVIFMKGKNLLFVFADQWRRSAIGYEGSEQVKTPRMDQFARESVYCTNAVSACPLCSPHRASMLTGRYPLSTGVITNCKPELPYHLQDSEICISDVLKENGYNTGYIGKWHLDLPQQRTGAFPESGAVRWDAFTPPGKGRHGFDFWYSYGAWDAHMHPHYWRDTPQKIQIDQWSPEHETDVAINFMRSSQKPFALFVSWNPPHPPYDSVPQKYLDLYKDEIIPKANSSMDRFLSHTVEATDDEGNRTSNMQKLKQYYAAISGLDEQFGRILDFLKESGLQDDTYVVLSADHGDMMGSHGLVGKHVWYEESIGIPFIVSGPGLHPGQCGTVISSTDIMPTLLELLDLPVPPTVEGESCMDSIVQCKTAAEKVSYLGCYPGFWMYLREFENAAMRIQDFGWRAIRTPQYTFVIDIGYHPNAAPIPEFHLYDLKQDPLQINDLITDANAYPFTNSVAKSLYQQLTAFMEKSNDGMLAYLPR